MNGTISRILGPKGFGFIKAEDGSGEYFFHREDCEDDFNELTYAVDSGEKIDVTFDSVPSNKGPRAANVVRIPLVNRC